LYRRRIRSTVFARRNSPKSADACGNSDSNGHVIANRESKRTAVSFANFHGNARIVAALRGMLSAERVPHAMLFSGPRGVGKFTLARMFAQAANCERMRDDFC